MEKISFKKDLKGVLYFNADINFWYNLNWRNAKIEAEFIQIRENVWGVNLSYQTTIQMTMSCQFGIDVSPKAKDWDSDFLKACNIEITEPFYILFDEKFKVDVIEYKIRKFEEFKAKVFLWCKSSFAVDFVVRESYFKEMQEIGVSLKKEISEKLVAIDELSQRISKINLNTNYSIDAIELGALTFFDWINNLISIDDIYRQLPTKEEVKGIENLFFDEFYLADEEIRKRHFDAIDNNQNTEKLWEFLNKNLSGRTWNYETPKQVLQIKTLSPAKQIIEHILNLGLGMEKTPNTFSKMGEDDFRNNFLVHLNASEKTVLATGETFNKYGKADILVQNSKKEIIFLAECKLWKGEGEIIPAIEQLFSRYEDWRNDQVAIIIFNNQTKGFSQILEAAKNQFKEHHLFIEYIEETKQNCSFSYIFKHPDDDERHIKTELIIFNFYTSKPTTKVPKTKVTR